MSEINFFKEDIKLDLRMLKGYKSWIEKIAVQYNQPIGVINYVFCSDEFLYNINMEYLDHDTYTDIITFDLREGQLTEPIEADIFISIDRIKENADKEVVPFKKELARVIIHGLLHLIGYNDKNDNDKKIMRSKESEAIDKFKIFTVPRGTHRN